MKIREAIRDDLSQLTEIYNQAIRAGFQTADRTPLSVEDRRPWFESHQKVKYPLWVAEEEGRIMGYLTLSPYRPGREALRFTSEISYYIHCDVQGRGVGSRLMAHALEAAPSLGHRTLFAILIDRNKGSIALLEKFGFVKWGHLPAIADYDGEEAGQYYYGRRLTGEM
ncbi:MAG: GNAT family N-acetyltransferase [Spirochaetales bacterium]|nr:GNAT family N-acetyltransferase [Spirochaetales bacterium]